MPASRLDHLAGRRVCGGRSRLRTGRPGWDRVREPFVHERRGRDQREADDEEDQRERRDPARQPEALGEGEDHLVGDPGDNRVEPQDLPEGAAVRFQDEVPEAVKERAGSGHGSGARGLGVVGRRVAALSILPSGPTGVNGGADGTAAPARLGSDRRAAAYGSAPLQARWKTSPVLNT